VVTWNCNGILHGTHELNLLNLLAATDPDIVTLSEVELPATAAPFAVDGYTSFYPLSGEGKSRVLILVKTELAACSNARVEATLM
jgi:exonuclease III